MSKTNLDAIIAVQDENPAEFQSVVSELLKDKIGDNVGVKKFEIASNFFDKFNEDDSDGDKDVD